MSDINIMRMENEELSHKTKKALIDIILQNGEDGSPFKLPNEDELSQRLGVSRNVLRDALTSLEEVGIVTRRRSKGTIANPRVASATCRLDIGPELYHMMEDAGYQVRVETLRLGVEYKADPAFPNEESYVNVEKVFYADETPAAYCADHIARSYADRAKDPLLDLENISHYQFLERYCNTSMAYTMAHIDAQMPEPWLAQILQTSPGEPVLSMDDYAYNFDHELVAHSTIYFKRGFLDLKFLRKSW